ncbi:MAG TPA: metallophosphoesterase, partial [Pricia sp.]|nr:metallophosphoesterase [Pricia sp.]
ELEFKGMSMLRYDAATIGNHDFDNGIGGLLAQLPHAEFDLLSANYDFSDTVMYGQVKPYKTYVIDGIRIGVYGLGIALDGLVDPKMYKETKYLNPYEIAMDTERRLKEDENCHLIICLSHLGYDYEIQSKPNDRALAAKTRYTDLIIGGHTHTFLDRPTLVQNANGHEIMINQVGCFGIYLGRIDFYFDSGKPPGGNTSVDNLFGGKPSSSNLSGVAGGSIRV